MTYHELITLRLESERLVLRVLDESFAGTVCEYLVRNREHFANAGPKVGEEFFTEAFQRRRLLQELEEMRRDQKLRLYVFRRDDPRFRNIIGDLSLSNIIMGPLCSCFLGYKTDQLHTGHGYMTEAVGRALEHAFAELGLHRVEANVMPTNAASLRVVEKLGFEREGYSRKYLKINGRWEDHCRYAMLNPNEE